MKLCTKFFTKSINFQVNFLEETFSAQNRYHPIQFIEKKKSL